MVRPRSFDAASVVRSVKEEFWDEGFDATGVSDLERATGLNRSSLYQAFGSKGSLFEAALDVYIADFVDPRIAPMERNGAGLPEVKHFFLGLGDFFAKPSAQRGCMWVNAIGELSGRSADVEVRGAEYLERLRAAFRNALTGAFAGHPGSSGGLERRARLLAATTLGIWLAARVDTSLAAISCRAVVDEIDSWASAL